MTSLWLAIAALLVMAVAFMCWPLFPFFRNNQSASSAGQKQENIDIFRDRLAELEYEKTQGNLDEEVFMKLKTELEKSLLQDTATQENRELEQVEVSGKHWMIVLSLSLAVAVVSLGMYFNLGRSDDLLMSQAMAGDAVVDHQAENQQPPPSMAKSIQILEAKLEQDPKNLEKLYLLANSYSAVGRFDKAVEIFGRMADQAEAGSEEFASYKGAQAQSLFQATGEQMTPGVEKFIKEALSIDPQEPSSLMLKGINAFSSSEYQQAIDFWEKAKVKSGEQQTARFIEPAIKAAQEKMGVVVAKTESETKTKTKVTQPQSSATTAGVTVELSLNEALKSRVKGSDVIFVFARPVGGRMPLAAERIKVQDLPKRIVLDDTKAAMPTATISSVDVVEITARVSLSGRPMQQKGDLFATVVDIKVKENPVIQLEINQIAE